MKNLAKIFMAVAALVAVSCTTDATEDLTANIVGGGETTITLSLEESRTQLGEKVDGVYPLYWSAGDKISVNGVESAELTEGGSASATFTLGGTINYPYSVVYPASSANQVTFLAEQTYTPGTFCAGAAPMYGYAANADEAIQMTNLVGALRLDVSGDATLSSLTIEAESGNLAGTYKVDCATGALTLVEGTASNKVTLSFDEGLKLGAEATPIHVAVPAGSYGVVTVAIYSTENEVMTVKFNTVTKPVKAGVVREFDTIAYEGTAESGNGVIDSKEALIKFAANPTCDAVVTANIDMTGYDWTPIQGCKAITFDGGNYEIKGLSAALFQTLEDVVVKNLKLVDVDITITEPYVRSDGKARVASGAIAYYSLNSSLSNCYASGNIVINTKFNEAATTEAPNTNTVVDIAGLVGYTSKTTLNKLTNAVNINVKSLFDTSDGNKSGFYILVGGITAVVYDMTSIEEMYNYGDITFNFEGGTQTASAVRFGAMFGYTPKINSFKKVENYGDVSISNLASTGGQYYGGIVGLAYSTPTFDTCKCSGAITVSSTAGGNVVTGPIAATSENNITLKNCTVSNNSEGKGTTLSVSCEKLYTGIVGYIASSTSKLISHTIENCVSTRDLWLTSDASTTSSTYLTHGFADTQSSSLSKIAMTNFTVSGDIIANGTVASLFYVGGIYGYVRASNNSTYTNVFTNCTYSGDIKMIGSFANRSTIGGLIGYNSANYITLDNCHSTGNIIFENYYSAGDVNNYVAVGGIIGYCGQEVEYKSLCTSSMNLAVSGTCKATNPLYVGGIAGLVAHNEANRYNAMNVVNSGNITIGKDKVTTIVNNLCVGGVLGKITNSRACTGYENAVNTGDITIVGTIEGVTDASYVGGIAGYTEEPIVNASAYCAIIAPGFKTGWITGVARTTGTLAKDCKVGGTFYEYDKKDGGWIPTSLTEDNYFNYIYGSGADTDWTGTDNHDGCTCITSKPE